MKKILLMLLGALLSLPAMAQQFSEEYNGQTLTYSVIDAMAKTCQLNAGDYNDGNPKAGNNFKGELVIPSEVKNGATTYTVVAIGDYGFYGCDELTSIIIPETVKSLGQITFYDCTALKTVQLPSGLTTIGKSVFCGCSSLESVVIPDAVTTIGRDAFTGCEGLTKAEFASIESLLKIKFESDSNPLIYAHNLYINGEEVTDIVIPESFTEILDYTFAGSAIKSIVIPSSVTSMGRYAFSECVGLTKAEFASIESLLKIKFKYDSNPLEYAHNLYINGEEVTDVVIPESFTEILDYTFVGSAIKSVVIPSSVTSIGMRAFDECNELNSVSLPEELTTIEWGAFRNCTSLTSINFPESLTKIGGYAFSGCTGLTSLHIPAGIEEIGEDALGCRNVREVYYPAENPVECDYNAFTYRKYILGAPDYNYYRDIVSEGTLYVPAEAVEKCKKIDPWKQFKNIQAYDFNSGIEDVVVDTDASAPCEIYNLSGVKVGSDLNGLTPGLYIFCQGNRTEKVMVK
ncbi:MAG: leucine-rich repeat domain-containing protein [Bacteroidales bacterium]|nr:leucine-rich repeat domain-containing protein [Bacteroidales bacterium]